MIVVEKVISGGQTGVDQVGLRVAKALGYKTGGTVPKGCRTDEGPAPWLVTEYGCVESSSSGYNNRTIDNIYGSDFTVWFGDETSPGGKLTLKTAERRRQENWHAYAVNPNVAQLYAALVALRVCVLNVAGNRLRTNPAASVRAEEVLRAVLDQR